MFLKRLLFTETKVLITQFQQVGQASRSQVDNLRDQIQDLMTKLFLRKKMHSINNHLIMFLIRHLFMVISLYTILYQEVGLENKSRADNSRDQTLVLMMRLSSRRNNQFKVFNN